MLARLGSFRRLAKRFLANGSAQCVFKSSRVTLWFHYLGRGRSRLPVRDLEADSRLPRLSTTRAIMELFN